MSKKKDLSILFIGNSHTYYLYPEDDKQYMTITGHLFLYFYA